MSKTPGSVNTWQPDHPYNDLPRLPPTAELETRNILRSCIGARAALAELKRAAELIPNQSILINTLPLLEAQASSEIENIVTTADELFRSLPEESGTSSATKEALRYREALLEGFRLLESRPLSTGLAEMVATRIKGVEIRVRKTSGTVLQNSSTGEIIYTPPQGEAVLRNLLSNWEDFLHGSEELDPLIRMAVAHYQFEAIHPFVDANGRTGRILNTLYLIEKGLLTIPILYLSRHFINNRADYYRHLQEVTGKGAWEDWILFVLTGVEETATWTLRKIEAIRELQAHTVEYVRQALPKTYSRELVELIFEQPYSRIGNLVERGIAKRQTASKYLYALSEIGVLHVYRAGREALFVHPKLLNLLTTNDDSFEPYKPLF